MIRKPRIPWHPQERPEQPGEGPLPLPPRPAGFQGMVDWIQPMPDDARPARPPRSAVYLGTVEWAWDPYHTRIDSYYLNRRPRHWLLWARYQDENTGNWTWTWSLYAYAPSAGASQWEAACYLLMDAWKAEAEGDTGLDRYHWIDEVGELSVEEMEAIAAVVWPGSEPTVVEHED